MLKKYTQTLLTIAFLLQMGLAYSQKSTEAEIYERIQNKQYIKNFDSLNNLSYIKKLNYTSNKVIDNQFDTVLINKRLKEAKTFFEVRYISDIHNFIRLYTQTNRPEIELMLGLSANYLPMFERHLTAQQLPTDLKFLPLAVSSLYPTAVSPNGAVGMWQMLFMPAKMYKLKISNFVDERRIPEKETEVAVLYLKDMYKIYRDWGLSIAAYGCGPATVNKAISRAGNKRNVWDIYPFLPKETREIVPSFVAMLYLTKYYQMHNITPANVKINTELDTVNIKKRLHLGQVSDLLNIPLQELKEINPKYRQNILHPSEADCFLTLPKGKKAEFLKQKNTIFAYRDSMFFNIRPVAKPIASKTIGLEKISHKVEKGENLKSIAAEYGVSPSQITHWNRLRRGKISVGKNLAIYIPKKVVETTGTMATSTLAPNTNALTSTNTSKTLIHKVRKKESIQAIAKKYNVSVEDIKKWNNLRQNKLTVGKELSILQKSKVETHWATIALNSDTSKPIVTTVPITKVITESEPEKITHKVGKKESLETIAKKYKVSVADLKKWNKLKQNKLTVGKDLLIYPNRKEDKPTLTTSKASNSEETQKIIHKVRKKESLEMIAKKYGVTVNEIKKWNQLKQNKLSAGTPLTIYQQQQTEVVAAVEKVELEPTTPIKTITTNEKLEKIVHKVRKNETLDMIAKKYEVSSNDIKKWNRLTSAKLSAGKDLMIYKVNVIFEDTPTNNQEVKEKKTTKKTSPKTTKKTRKRRK